MPVYTVEELLALKNSELVVVPEFKWNEIETAPEGSNVAQDTNSHGGNWRRGSHNSKRPVVMPKAAIPFSQRALFDSKAGSEAQSAVAEDAEGGDSADDDEFAARYLLKNKRKAKKPQETEGEDGAPVVNLSYAAALAASMKMNEARDGGAVEEGAEGDDAGWVSVSHANKPRRNRNKGSFSRWKS